MSCFSCFRVLNIVEHPLRNEVDKAIDVLQDLSGDIMNISSVVLDVEKKGNKVIDTLRERSSTLIDHISNEIEESKTEITEILIKRGV